MPYPTRNRRPSDLTARSVTGITAVHDSADHLNVRFTTVEGIEAVRRRSLDARLSRWQVARMLGVFRPDDLEPSIAAAFDQVTAYLARGREVA